MTTFNVDGDGFRSLHIATHSRSELWRYMNEAQKVACTLMEKWGWELLEVDEDRLREVRMYKPGEMITVIRRR